MTEEKYRRQVLGQVVKDWPESVSPQVLQTRLTEYKHSLCNAALARCVCASCACATHARDLHKVQIYSTAIPTAPPWTGWTNEQGQSYGAT